MPNGVSQSGNSALPGSLLVTEKGFPPLTGKGQAVFLTANVQVIMGFT